MFNNYMKILFFVLTFLLFPVFAFSGEWVLITELEGRKHYIDSGSISEKSGFKWAKHKSLYESQQKGEDYMNKKTYKFTTTNSLLAFNCRSKTMTPVKTVYLDERGFKVHEITFVTEEKVIKGDKQWELGYNPDTFRASVIDYICK